MKGVSCEMIFATRSESLGAAGAGAGTATGRAGAAKAEAGWARMETNPGCSLRVSRYPSTPAVYLTVIRAPLAST